MKIVKTLIPIAALGLVILFIAYHLLTNENSSQEISSPVKESLPVRLAVAKGFITGPVLIALEKGFFRDAGLDVTVTGEFSSGKDSFNHMLSGHADVSTPATTPVVFNSFKRQDYAIFVTYVTSYKGIKLIARKDRQIRDAKELKGKTIGLVPGTISEILTDSLLAYNQIFRSETIIKEYKGHELPTALKRGDVDAISVWEPHAHRALNELSQEAIEIPTAKVYRIATNLAGMNTFAKENPQVLERMVEALIATIAFMKEEPAEAQAFLSKDLSMDLDLVRSIWGDVDFEISLDQLLVLTMENEARWFAHQQNLEMPLPNYLNFINPKPLLKIAPEAVTLILEEP